MMAKFHGFGAFLSRGVVSNALIVYASSVQVISMALFLSGRSTAAVWLFGIGLGQSLLIHWSVVRCYRRADAARAEAMRREHVLRHALELAETDPVTGLLTRRRIIDRLEQADPAEMLTVAVFDVDDMHGINASFQHAGGDAYLAGIAARLRALAGPGDIVARLGGDEFALVTDRAPAAVAARLVAALRDPVNIGDTAVTIQMSAGLHRIFGGDAHTALGCADAAMFTAKLRRSVIEQYDRVRDGVPLIIGERPRVRRRDVLGGGVAWAELSPQARTERLSHAIAPSRTSSPFHRLHHELAR